MEYEFHAAANIYPLMSEDRLDDMADDIGDSGQLVPIELCDGKIIDGRNRYRACLIAGVEPEFVTIETPKDPVAYVHSLNMVRRHLTQSQLAMVANNAAAYYESDAKERMEAGKESDPSAKLRQGSSGKTKAKAGKEVGVSTRSVESASKVKKKGSPALIKAVEDGNVSVSNAEKITSAPKKEQTRLAKKIVAGEITGADAVRILKDPAPEEPDDAPEPGSQPDMNAEVSVAIARKTEYAKWVKTLGTLRSWIKDEVVNRLSGRQLGSNSQAAMRHCDDLQNIIRATAPHGVCGYCEARHDPLPQSEYVKTGPAVASDCCMSSGLLPKGIYDNQPREMKL